MPRYVNTENNSNIEAVLTYPESKTPNMYIRYKNFREEMVEGNKAILEKFNILCDCKNHGKDRKISKEIEENIKNDFPLIFSSNIDLSNVVDTSSINREKSIISYGIRNTFNEQKRNDVWMGVSPEDTPLPLIPRGSKVIDIGAGDGLMTQRLRDELKCEAYALEPCLEYKTGYDECVKRLGKEHSYQLTLQEAINKHPEIFKNQFDVATVFKYCIDSKDKEEFIKSLAQIIKPNGTVYITSVERDRLFFESSSGEGPYITGILQKYFGHVKIDLVHVPTCGVYGLVECASPRLELQNVQRIGIS